MTRVNIVVLNVVLNDVFPIGPIFLDMKVKLESFGSEKLMRVFEQFKSHDLVDTLTHGKVLISFGLIWMKGSNFLSTYHLQIIQFGFELAAIVIITKKVKYGLK